MNYFMRYFTLRIRVLNQNQQNTPSQICRQNLPDSKYWVKMLPAQDSVKCHICLYVVSVCSFGILACLHHPFLHLFSVHFWLMLPSVLWKLIILAKLLRGWREDPPPPQNTGYTPSLAAPPSIVCCDKIWTEELLGKSFISQV